MKSAGTWRAQAPATMDGEADRALNPTRPRRRRRFGSSGPARNLPRAGQALVAPPSGWSCALLESCCRWCGRVEEGGTAGSWHPCRDRLSSTPRDGDDVRRPGRRVGTDRDAGRRDHTGHGRPGPPSAAVHAFRLPGAWSHGLRGWSPRSDPCGRSRWHQPGGFVPVSEPGLCALHQLIYRCGPGPQWGCVGGSNCPPGDTFPMAGQGVVVSRSWPGVFSSSHFGARAQVGSCAPRYGPEPAKGSG